MKKILLMITLILTGFIANAQNNEEDKNSGKYLKAPGIENLLDTWVSTEKGKELEFVITIKKMHNKSNELDYYYDELHLKITKCIYNGKDVTNQINRPVILMANMPSSKSLNQTDPVTNSKIKIALYYENKDKILFRVSPVYSNTTSVLPVETILTRKK